MKTKEIIKEYFKDETLKVLDKETTKGVYGAFGKEFFYGAVSLNYIHKYVLKSKVSKKFTARTIFTLCKEGLLLPIPCNFASNIVFCRQSFAKEKSFYKFSYNDKKIIIEQEISYTSAMDKKWINNFNKYLK